MCDLVRTILKFERKIEPRINAWKNAIKKADLSRCEEVFLETLFFEVKDNVENVMKKLDIILTGNISINCESANLSLFRYALKEDSVVLLQFLLERGLKISQDGSKVLLVLNSIPLNIPFLTLMVESGVNLNERRVKNRIVDLIRLNMVPLALMKILIDGGYKISRDDYYALFEESSVIYRDGEKAKEFLSLFLENDRNEAYVSINFPPLLRPIVEWYLIIPQIDLMSELANRNYTLYDPEILREIYSYLGRPLPMSPRRLERKMVEKSFPRSRRSIK